MCARSWIQIPQIEGGKGEGKTSYSSYWKWGKGMRKPKEQFAHDNNCSLGLYKQSFLGLSDGPTQGGKKARYPGIKTL